MRYAPLLAVLVLTLVSAKDGFGQDITIVSTEVGIEYSYTKFRTNVARRGGDLTERSPIFDQVTLDGSDTRGVIFCLHQVENEEDTGEDLRTVLDFVEQGGRAIIFYTDQAIRAYQDITLRTLGIALKRDPGIFTDRFTRNYITELGGGQIGSGMVEYQRGNIRSEYEPDFPDLYFLPPIGQREILDQNSVQSKASGEDRLVYLKIQHGEGQVIVTLSPQTREGFISPFFADTNYNLYDNRRLSSRLAAWLMGASPSS